MVDTTADNTMEQQSKGFDDETNRRIEYYWNLYMDDQDGFSRKYGDGTVDKLLEAYRRKNAYSQMNALPSENQASDAMENVLKDSIKGPDTFDEETGLRKETNPLAQFGKGGARGFALLWNGIVDMGRGMIDPENHAKYKDLFRNRLKDVRAGRKERDSFERYWEDVKRAAAKGEKGFKYSWARSVMEKDEIDPRTGNVYGTDEGGAWMKFDEIPFLNEDLGLIGKAAEIAVQEAVTMGPLAAFKLWRASKAAKYFADKAGGTIFKGKYVEEGADKGKFIMGKELTEKDGADYQNYMEALKTMSPSRAKKMKRLQEVYQREGRFAKRAPFMQGGGAYMEAELLASSMVVTGGIMAQSMFGRDASVIGEIGGGIFGPAIIAKGGRVGLDWFNYLAYKLPGNETAKQNRALRAMGFKTKDIETMNPETKGQLVAAGTSMPAPNLMIGFLDFSSKERKALTSFRWLNDEFEALPDELKDPLMKRMAYVKRIVAKYDKDNSGKVFATIDRAMEMSWLNTLRSISRQKIKLGKTVKAKLNVEDMTLARREMESAEELNNLLMDISQNTYGDTNFELFIDGLQEQLSKHLDRMGADKGSIARQAREYKKSIVRKLRPELAHLNPYTTADNWIYDPSTAKLKESNTRYIMRENPETGRMEPVQGEDGLPMREKQAQFDAVNEWEADNFVGEEFIENSSQAQYDTIVDDLQAFWIPIKDANGKVIRRVLATKNKNTSSDLGALKSESDAMIRKAEADDMGLADDVYGQVKGYKISPAKAVPDQTTAITSEQLNILMRNVGEEVDSMIDELPEGVEILADIKGVKGRRVMDWMREERGVALTNRYNQLVKELGKDAADVQFAKELDQMSARMNLKTPDILGEGGKIDSYKLDQYRGAIALNTKIPLMSDVHKLDVSLQDISRIRGSLFKNAMEQIQSKNNRMAALYNFRLGNRLTTELDQFNDLKNANKFWKENVGEAWREGLGSRILIGLKYGDEPAERIMSNFLFPRKSGYATARQQFDKLFLRLDPNTKEKVYNPQAKQLLLEYLGNASHKEGRQVDEQFFNEFADILNLVDESGNALEEAGAIGSAKWRTASEEAREFGGRAQQVIKESEANVNLWEKTAQNAVNRMDEYNPFGVPIEDLANIAGLRGQGITAPDLIKRVLVETYDGGDPRKARAIANYLKTKPEALEQFRKVLFEGAIEAAYRDAKHGTVHFKPGKIKIGEDGTKVIPEGEIVQRWELNGAAMQKYIERNTAALKDILGDKFDDLKELNSLVTLITGEMPYQAIENYPKGLKLNSIMSRVYGVVRGVVSPRYVMMELLIQDARFRRGQMIKDLAVNPEAFNMLSEVILRNGLTKPRIRSEFVQWFWGGMARYARDTDEDERQAISEDEWNNKNKYDRLYHSE